MAQLIIAGIVLVTFSSTAVGVYLRFGQPGLMIVGLGAAYILVMGIGEGIGTALLGRLLGRIWPDRLKQAAPQPIDKGDAANIDVAKTGTPRLCGASGKWTDTDERP